MNREAHRAMPVPPEIPIARSAAMRVSTSRMTPRGCRTERDANADLVLPTRHGVHRQAIQAHAGEQQPDSAEKAGNLCEQTLLRQRGADLIGQRPERQGQVGIDLGRGLRNASRQQCR